MHAPRFTSSSIGTPSGSTGPHLRIGIAGAGVLGRLAAWSLAQAGHRVTVFDPATGPEARQDGLGPAGFTAAGMLSPLAELDHASAAIAMLGWRSIALWRQVADRLAADGGAPAPLLMQQRGSLLLAHAADLGSAQRVLDRLAQAGALHEAMPRPQALTGEALRTLEPALEPHLRAWLLPGEGQVMSPAMLCTLAGQAPQVQWRWSRTVTALAPGVIELDDGERWDADWVLDLRGLGARGPTPRTGAPAGAIDRLRGVRGEVVWLHAPGVVLNRPVRLMHPRHRVYLVPRPGDLFVLGASEIESEDRSPVSLRSAVELMAAAHSVVPALAEARIVHLESNLRPALPDNEPHTELQPGLLRINGLFRHGWLLAPALLQDGLAQAGLGSALGEPR
ncbi:glycine oxidase [Sphaerotilus hippei]|uniref:Glycine oxidase n=1 Tax=Sphaerotilus hippei TaxID=744406 RepID=A0A318H3F8_9BURK|nr:FAD-dependent oxidoreductase [Sphaerotilus hippei]PXW98077.1 glycine oxidase [Sphaerotilus hippei]